MLRKYRINRNAYVSFRRPDKDIERARSGGLDPKIDDDGVGRHALGSLIEIKTRWVVSDTGGRVPLWNQAPVQRSDASVHNDKLLPVMRQAHFKDRLHGLRPQIESKTVSFDHRYTGRRKYQSVPVAEHACLGQDRPDRDLNRAEDCHAVAIHRRSADRLAFNAQLDLGNNGLALLRQRDNPSYIHAHIGSGTREVGRLTLSYVTADHNNDEQNQSIAAETHDLDGG